MKKNCDSLNHRGDVTNSGQIKIKMIICIPYFSTLYMKSIHEQLRRIAKDTLKFSVDYCFGNVSTSLLLKKKSQHPKKPKNMINIFIYYYSFEILCLNRKNIIDKIRVNLKKSYFFKFKSIRRK